MPTYQCPDHAGEMSTFEIPDNDHADREHFYSCGRRVTGADERIAWDLMPPAPTAGPAEHTIGTMTPTAPLPAIGARVRTVVDRMDGTSPPPARRGQVVGHAVTHYRPGDTDDPRAVHVLAVVALDLADQGWLLRGVDQHNDHSCYVGVILADPDSLEPDPYPAAGYDGERLAAWGIPDHLPTGPSDW